MGMEYLDENGLARYDGLIKNWTTFKSGTVDGVDPLLNWQKTATAASVTCYPLPAAPLEPTVTFQFTETPPADGQPKSPTNPSTITGVSTITVTRCETVGVDETQYTVDLGDTYYGGSVDLSAGTMTVTHEGIAFDGTENWILDTPASGQTVNRFYIRLGSTNPHPYGNAVGADESCTHFPYNATAVPNEPAIRGTRSFVYLTFDKESVADLKSWLASQSSNGTPVVFVYGVETPYTVPLTPTQIYSLSQLDPYTPRLNTVYSDQTSVQVGYPKSPLATASELTNAIISLGGNV